jgi:hypothetical protein
MVSVYYIDCQMIIILLLTLIFCYFLIYYNGSNQDNFLVYWSGPPVSGLNYSDHTNFPFWNSRIGQTTNMSYDLRSDPIEIPKYPFAWNYSTLTPIYPRPLV